MCERDGHMYLDEEEDPGSLLEAPVNLLSVLQVDAEVGRGGGTGSLDKGTQTAEGMPAAADGRQGSQPKRRDPLDSLVIVGQMGGMLGVPQGHIHHH